jgi:plasmid stabilization system protein ParE
MTELPIALEPEAEADLLDAYEWYESRREGLGREFIECVDSTLAIIGEGPKKYGLTHQGVRQALIRRFPYVICYVIEDRRVAVIAVMHSGRDPQQWQSRL